MLLSQAAELQELRDLVKRLLTHSPSQRLGSLKGGALDVKAHPWFKDFDWESFEKQTMPAPYIPKVSLASLHFMSWWPSQYTFPRSYKLQTEVTCLVTYTVHSPATTCGRVEQCIATVVVLVMIHQQVISSRCVTKGPSSPSND